MNVSTKSIVSVILIALTILLGYFVLMPRWNSYNEAQQVLEDKLAQKAQLEKGQAQLNSFLNEYKQNLSSANLLNQALPLSKPELYNVLNSLDTLTKQSGLTLGGLSIVDTPESDTLGAVPSSILPIDLGLTVYGNYSAFKFFLTNLESNLRIIDVNALTVQGGETANSMGFNMVFRSYYQK
jgi:Tfp pilus assembly protein PilO